MNRQVRTGRVLLWALPALVVLAVLALALRGSRVAVQTSEASTGQIIAFVEDRGRTSLPDEARLTISMPVDGRVLSVGPEIGEPVKSGQALAVLDTKPLSLAVAQAKAAVEGNKVRLELNAYDKLEKTALREAADLTRLMASVVEASQKRVESSKVRFDFAELQKQSIERLNSEDAANALELQKARTDAAAAGVDLSYQRFLLAATRVIEEVVNLYPNAVTELIELKGIYRGSIEQQLAASHAQLAEAELRLGDATERVKSPIDGVVLERYVTDERLLTGGTPLIEVGDLSRLEAKVDLLTQDAVEVSVGDRAEVFGLLADGSALPATVSRVDPTAFTKLSSLGVEEQRVWVTVSFDDKAMDSLRAQTRSVGAEYRVRVRVHTAEADRTVIVPRSALFRGDDGGWRVFTVRGGRARLTPITIGLVNDAQAQVVNGLDDAAVVVIAPGSDLHDGVRVSDDRAQH